MDDTLRLDRCGWSSFRPDLFLNEPGRLSRDLGGAFLKMLRDFSGGKRILELCCGAGRLLIHLARHGYEVVGLDLSREMLDICRQGISREDREVLGRIRLVQGDMCGFDLRGHFDFVILEDDGFVYLLTQEDQLACLAGVTRHLSPEGRFFLSFTTPARELVPPHDYEYDPIRQVKTSRNRWQGTDDEGNPITVEEGFERRRLTYPCELELLMRLSGLEIVHRWGDLDRSPFQDPSTQEYHYLIRKAP